MKPLAIARKWAKEHPEYTGILVVKAQTPRGRGGRLGTKTTHYEYVISEGKATRKTYITHRKPLRCGICDVTGQVHHKKVLSYYHLPHPQKGECPPDELTGSVECVYNNAWFVTTKEVAFRLEAKQGQGNEGSAWFDGLYNCQHPEFNLSTIAWLNRVVVEGGTG